MNKIWFDLIVKFSYIEILVSYACIKKEHKMTIFFCQEQLHIKYKKQR